ncbi:MAG TPA: alpha/beta fold hydrolase [Terracidiphilus sp.]
MTHAVRALLPAVLASLLSAAYLPAQTSGVPLTVERIYGHGPLAGNLPEGLTWSPDSKHLTYLDSGELIDLDPGTGKPHVLVSRAKLASLSGAEANEQDRDHRDRYKMASYLWAPDSRHLLFDSNGRLWLYDLGTGTGIQVGFTDAASGDDPKFSPNGETISFVRNHGLSIVHPRDVNNAGAFPVAAAPSPTTTNGEVDWVYEEELEVRSNYFWSPDSKNIAFLQTNETDVPLYPITDWIPEHASVDLQRYPQPGDPNPDVRLGVVNGSGGHISWIRMPIKAGQDYVPRFGWVDQHTLWMETVLRNQQHRYIDFIDIASGQGRQILEITDDKFLDDNYDVFVEAGNIVLSNWKDGHNHLYLYKYDARNPMAQAAPQVKQLTTGDWDVTALSVLDARGSKVFYTSNEGNPLEQQVWQVDFDGKRTQISSGAGYHDANFAPSGSVFVDKYSTLMTPPRLSLCQVGGKCNVFWAEQSLERYNLRPPEQIEVKAGDGAVLYGTLFLPAGDPAPASVPLIVNPYGGPGVQTVKNEWSDSLFFDELLTQHGFAVLHADNRGAANRGRDFALAAYHNFGPIQLEDQLAVMDAALAKYPQIDKNRLGWWGWSWGGTFTLYALTHSDRFQAGVAVAPVTDWHNYDSIYTERYMSQPAEFPAGYRDFSVVNSAPKLKGHLLLVHGTGDDNVHMENTVQFIQKLIEADLPYDLQLYPRKTHSIAGTDVRTHLFNRILEHFEQYLKPAPRQEK